METLRPFFKADAQYETLAAGHSSRDGAKAISVYLIDIGLTFFQGFLYTTNVDTVWLVSMQVSLPAAEILICLAFVLRCCSYPRIIQLNG